MKFEMISNLNKKYYRNNFVNWMGEEYPNIKRPDIIFSNIMLSIKNDIGFSINDLILKVINKDQYCEKYRLYFESIQRKSPKGHAAVQKWNAEFFTEFIYKKYSSGFGFIDEGTPTKETLDTDSGYHEKEKG